MTDKLKQGSLEERIFPFLLRDISRNRISGMLSLKQGIIRKFIFFENGTISFVQSSLPQEQLAGVILRGGGLDETQYVELLDLVRDGGWHNPEIQKQGLFERSKLEWWLKTLAREVIMSLFTWDDGVYRFFFGKKAPDTCIKTQIDPIALVFTCVRRIRDPHVLVGWLSSLDAVPKVNYKLLTECSSSLNISPQEGFFISRIDGVLTFRNILSMTGSQRLEMLQFFVAAVIADLIEIGLGKEIIKPRVVQSVEPETEPEPEPAPPPDEPPSPPAAEVQSYDATDDIALTEEELKELATLEETGENLDMDLTYSGGGYRKSSDVKLDSKVSYLRGSEFVDASDESVDVDELKSKKLVPTAEEFQLDDKVTLLIDGKEFDAEDNMVGGSSIENVFESDDSDEQWNRWMVVDVDVADEDGVEIFQHSWKDWEDQARELQLLRDRKEEIEEEIRTTKNSEKISDLKLEFSKTERFIQRLIDTKKKEVLNALRRSKTQTHYELLHVPRNSSLEDIKAAYFKWINEYQPEERFRKHFEILAESLERLSERLHLAYEVLSNPEARDDYDNTLIEHERMVEKISQKKKMLAQDHLGSSREALARGDAMLAMRFLRGSMSLDPRNPAYYEQMAKILTMTPKYYNEALKFYHRAFHLDPENPDLLVEVAKLSVKMDQPEFAVKALKQAIQIKPNHGVAKKLLNVVSKK